MGNPDTFLKTASKLNTAAELTEVAKQRTFIPYVAGLI